MKKRLASAAALTLLLAGAAIAQTAAPPAEAVQAVQAGETTTDPSTAPAPTEAESAAPAPSETGSIPQPAEASAAPSENGSAAEASPDTAAVPDSPETCIAAAANLGSTAESKPLAPDYADRLDALFSKMETLCDGQQYAEAMDVAKDIKTMIDAN